jgi:predicted ribonuclease YlaK
MVNREKTYVLGLDVVSSSGSEAIKQLQDSDEEVIHNIYFDPNSLNTEERKDPAVRDFMIYAQQKAENRSEKKPNEPYRVNGVNVYLKRPEQNLEGIIGMTEDPYIEEDFRNKGMLVEPPRFLLKDPKVLQNGLIKPKIKISEKHLDDRLELREGIERFEIENPFINQFILVTADNGTQALYKINVDIENDSNDPEKYNYISEPYLQRIHKNHKSFRKEVDVERLFRETGRTMWGFKPNDLNQFLALEHLLLDPNIKLVVLSGVAGTGKTLVPYIAGLYQTLRTDPKENPFYEAIYLSRPLTSASEDVGFLPGELDDKLGPQFENFSGIHSYLNFSDEYKFEDALKPGTGNKLKKFGLYVPNDKKPLIYMKNPGFMRGINIRNAWIMYDEFQNFNYHNAKLLLTRAAKGSKIIICGDHMQIDNLQCSPQKNGLVFATHYHMQINHPHLGVMHFEKTDRNIIANYSALMPNYFMR